MLAVWLTFVVMKVPLLNINICPISLLSLSI